MGIQSFRGYYQAIWESDLMADVLEPVDVRTAPHRVLIAPWSVMVTDRLAADLRAYVEAGGTLVVQAGFGMHGEDGRLSSIAPTAGLAEAFGYRQLERISLGMRDVRGTIAESDRHLADAVLAFADPLGGGCARSTSSRRSRSLRARSSAATAISRSRPARPSGRAACTSWARTWARRSVRGTRGPSLSCARSSVRR